MEKQDLQSIKLGMVIKNNESQVFHIILAASENFIVTFNTYEGILHYIDINKLLKDYNVAKSKDYRSLVSNINTKLSVATNFIQGAIKLFQDNPIAYRDCMKSVDECNDELAYLSEAKLEESRIVVDTRTNKSYTISEVINYGNKLLFRLVRHAMVYGQIMDSEIINVSKQEFEKFFTYLNDKEIETNKDEEINISLEIPKNLFNETPRPKINKDESIQELPTMSIRSLKRLDELINTNYTDIFYVDDLNDKISFLSRENFLNQDYMVLIVVQERVGNIFRADKVALYPDGNSKILVSKFCSSLELYQDIATLENFEVYQGNESPQIEDGFVEKDQIICMRHELKAYDRKTQAFVELHLSDSNRLIYNDGNEIISVTDSVIQSSQEGFYKNRFCSIARAKDELDELNRAYYPSIYKVGNTIVYKEILPMVICEVKEKTISVLINFFKNRENHSIVKLSVPKRLIETNKEEFVFYPELSFYSFRL